MKKYILLPLIYLALLVSCSGPKSTKSTATSGTKNVNLVCSIEGCKPNDTLNLYSFNGVSFDREYWSVIDSAGKYNFDVNIAEKQFFYLGTRKDKIKPLILGTESEAFARGKCNAMRNVVFEEDSYNGYYSEVMRTMKGFENDARRISIDFRDNMQDKEKLQKIELRLVDLDNRKLAYLDSIRKVDDFIGQVVGFKTFISYRSNLDKAPTEYEYFKNYFFEHADLKNPNINNMPVVYEAFKNYCTLIFNRQLAESEQLGSLDNALEKLPSNSSSMKYALGGIMAALGSKNNPNYAVYGKRYIEAFGKEHPAEANMINTKIKSMAASVVGAEAPDFTMSDPAGGQISLSDYRGKVVLIDFWASWCGPCRRENPNVVKVYEKYKDKGFEIIGVSLDKTKSKWLKAIEKDNLTWPHVSDLKGWQNEVAGLYGVRSIPHTVLLDKDGKIIARKLKGHQLDRKLKEIFGE